jgi:MFS family permease
VSGAQILGGYLAPRIRLLFPRRTTALILGIVVSVVALALLGVTDVFWVALALLTVWGLVYAAVLPIRRAYLNDMIPSQQRATVLSFDSLMDSAGGVVIQPVLGRAADVYSYATSFVIGAAINLLAVPFVYASRREHPAADTATTTAPAPPSTS